MRAGPPAFQILVDWMQRIGGEGRSSLGTMSETQTIDIETLLAERDWLRGLARRLVADAGAADDLV